MYSYDRRSSSTIHPEVAVRIDGDRAIVSVLIGTLLGAYVKQVEGSPDAVRGDLISLKGRLESLTGSLTAVDEKAEDILLDAGYEMSRNLFQDRDPGLSRRQLERQKENLKIEAKAFGKWLREGVVKWVEEIYRDFKAGKFRKEPCITAAYLKEFLHEIPGWDDHASFVRKLDSKKRLQACHNALESAKKKGLLNTSTGMGMTGRETHCYEPARW